jgi:sulfite oxidase
MGAGSALAEDLSSSPSPSSSDTPKSETPNSAPHLEEVVVAGEYDADLPEYSLAEVQRQVREHGRLWTVYRYGVYDITEFVEQHPGGSSKISLAAGGSVEPFWRLYAFHSTHKDVPSMLEGLRVGSLCRSDADRLIAAAAEDPYAKEPPRAAEGGSLAVRSQRPYCAEPPLRPLGAQRITPVELFYVRNHLPVPAVDERSFRVYVSGPGVEPLALSVRDLRADFDSVEIEAVLQCGGNRRNEMSAVSPTRGGAWEQGAIGNALWRGARLRDVLLAMGVDETSKFKHIVVEGYDHDPEKPYAASIPLSVALSPDADVLLAYDMNGAPLTPDHGFPLRLVVPGVVGARNVKWIRHIRLSETECSGHWQRTDYKVFSSSVTLEQADYASVPAIQAMPVQSSITSPVQGAAVHAAVTSDGREVVRVHGFAWSGGGRGIARVDVSSDGGKHWVQARLARPDQPLGRVWAWTLWEADVPVHRAAPGARADLSLVCKAVDDSHNVQPESAESIWNVRGLLNNSWHRVQVHVQ